MSTTLPATRPHVSSRKALLNVAAGTLWHTPAPFRIARLLGRRYSLRCVLFHDVADTESVFTRGLGGTLTRQNFESALRFLTRHYTPVSLQDVLADFDGQRLPPRPVLVTFDDAYASVCEFAAPLCSKFGVAPVFFVNASCLDNRQLALDNLVCYVANVFGLGAINAAIRTVKNAEHIEVRTMAEIFARFLPSITLSARKVFRDALAQITGFGERELAANAGLYLSSRQLRDLATFNCEIGNHTYTHVNCRCLSIEDFAEQIDQNRAVLESTSGARVRSFSVPYGSSADLTSDLFSHLQQFGYEAVFLAESRSNSPSTHRLRLNRVSIKTGKDADLFSEIEVLPRLRTIRNRLLAASQGEAQQKNSPLEKGTPTPRLGAKREDTASGAPVPGSNLGV
jgi:peptidoglycan/xylan/chitin deacetylase (PgdA/CDA1 family)